MSNRRLLLVLACISGSLCLAAGLAYLSVSPSQLSIALLVAVGVAGCFTLVAAGIWQLLAGEETRQVRLVVLGALAALYALASGFGFIGAGIARSARLEPTALPRALHAAGFASGIVLCLAVTSAFGKVFKRLGHRLHHRGSQPV